ncbi:AcrR family transcriptional regulator [Streptomyces umbrinus]|uniref:AcrR family transcriptional regulator n=1 Tax=Streptomyces umbrinus TaxID=67370 RepID=A0ABU0SHF9_9ACTN|nr:helix-turn-helix domain-containing protein [Streptomyces umbrinus]MDQ1022990.1 AcrR family transcriptional regulator [Streptomyces umbrinus]
MTRASDGSRGERADAARNRARLLEVAARLVAERGAEHVTMHEVAEAAGVGKGTLFRRFGDRDGLLLALLAEAEAEFQEAYTSGPPPLGPGAPARDRLEAFGCALIERNTADADPGAALGRRLPHARRHAWTPPVPCTAMSQRSSGKRESTVTTTCSPMPCSPL